MIANTKQKRKINPSDREKIVIGDSASAMQLLKEREHRASKQSQLLQSWGNTLVVVKANFPGAMKHNPHTTTAVVLMWETIQSLLLQSIMQEMTNTVEGLIYYGIFEQDATSIKLAMTQLEDAHPLGRLVDIDVFTIEHNYSRLDIGIYPRSCFLCQEAAHVCGRSRKHAIEEIEAFFVSTVETYCAKEASNAILFALLAEASCFPKFGLVTPFTNGSHNDMDFGLFIRSAVAIAPMLAKAEEIDASEDYPSIFEQLRHLGKQIEADMMETTKGINTHKGAIFLFLLVLMGQRLAVTIDQIPREIRKLCAGLQQDFESIADKSEGAWSHGERLYRKHGIRGVRGLAMDGLTDVFEKYLPFYEQQNQAMDQHQATNRPTLENHRRDMNDCMVETLLLMMETCEDTTIIHRGGLEGLLWLQCEVKRVRQKEVDLPTFEQECVNRRLSPGGSADLLALVVYLDLMKRIKEEKK